MHPRVRISILATFVTAVPATAYAEALPEPAPEPVVQSPATVAEPAAPPNDAPAKPHRQGLYVTFGVGPTWIRNVHQTTYTTSIVGRGTRETRKATLDGGGVAVAAAVGAVLSPRWVGGGSLHFEAAPLSGTSRTTSGASEESSTTLGGAMWSGFASYHFVDDGGAYLQAHAGIAIANGGDAFVPTDTLGLGLGLGVGGGYDFSVGSRWKVGPAFRLTYLDARTNPTETSTRTEQDILGFALMFAATFD